MQLLQALCSNNIWNTTHNQPFMFCLLLLLVEKQLLCCYYLYIIILIIKNLFLPVPNYAYNHAHYVSVLGFNIQLLISALRISHGCCLKSADLLSVLHPTAVLQSHSLTTLLTLVSNWHCGVNLQGYGHIWLWKPIKENVTLKYTVCNDLFSIDHLHTYIASVFLFLFWFIHQPSHKRQSVSSLTLFTI